MLITDRTLVSNIVKTTNIKFWHFILRQQNYENHRITHTAAQNIMQKNSALDCLEKVFMRFWSTIVPGISYRRLQDIWSNQVRLNHEIRVLALRYCLAVTCPWLSFLTRPPQMLHHAMCTLWNVSIFFIVTCLLPTRGSLANSTECKILATGPAYFHHCDWWR